MFGFEFTDTWNPCPSEGQNHRAYESALIIWRKREAVRNAAWEFVEKCKAAQLDPVEIAKEFSK